MCNRHIRNQVMQPYCKIVKKVMINEPSTLLKTVFNLKVPPQRLKPV